MDYGLTFNAFPYIPINGMVLFHYQKHEISRISRRLRQPINDKTLDCGFFLCILNLIFFLSLNVTLVNLQIVQMKCVILNQL